VLKRTTLLTLAALTLGMALGYAAATGPIQRLFAADRAPDASPTATGSDVLPRPEPPFKGHIGRTPKDSIKDFPQEAQAPNVLLIMTDDVGFGAASTFGGPIPTPTFDRLARNGLRYTPSLRKSPG
jgi:Sulfatase